MRQVHKKMAGVQENKVKTLTKLDPEKGVKEKISMI